MPLWFNPESGVPTLVAQSHSFSNTNATSFTFSGMAVGTTSADRYIVVAVNVGTGTSFTSVTINGSAATLLVQKAGTLDSASAIYYLLVSSGTTADIVVTPNVLSVQCSVSLFSLTGWTGANTVTNSGNGASPITLSLTLPNDSVAVGAMRGTNAFVFDPAVTLTWNGLTVYNTDVASSRGSSQAYANFTTGGSPITISCATNATENRSIAGVSAGFYN